MPPSLDCALASVVVENRFRDSQLSLLAEGARHDNVEEPELVLLNHFFRPEYRYAWDEITLQQAHDNVNDFIIRQ